MAQDHVNVAESLSAQVILPLKNVERTSGEQKKKVFFAVRVASTEQLLIYLSRLCNFSRNYSLNVTDYMPIVSKYNPSPPFIMLDL